MSYKAIYTKNGDLGWTTLAKGRRVGKDHPTIEALGALDELNAHLGLATSIIAEQGNGFESPWLYPPHAFFALQKAQKTLLNIGAALAGFQPKTEVTMDDVTVLEIDIDSMTEKMLPLSEFILPGGSPLSAQLHVCRAVARRAERAVWESGAMLNKAQGAYLNRLSDWLFTLARMSSIDLDGNEQVTTWLN